MALLEKTKSILLTLGFGFATLIFLYASLSPNQGSHRRSKEDDQWISTSNSWIDRTACRWIGICGGTNWLWQTRLFRSKKNKSWSAEDWDFAEPYYDWNVPEEELLLEDASKREIPQCIIDYAPLVFLHPDEPYWVSNPSEHLRHVIPTFKDKIVENYPLSLKNISRLNDFAGGEEVCLTSKDNIQDYPPWMYSNYSIPVSFPQEQLSKIKDGSVTNPLLANKIAIDEGWYEVNPYDSNSGIYPSYKAAVLKEATTENLNKSAGYSSTPAILITIRKSNDVLDAYWFLFNSYNQGNKVVGIRFGDHVGDWEHISKSL
jgi:hypothetical protein